jgi:hypothetical protein
MEKEEEDADYLHSSIDVHDTNLDHLIAALSAISNAKKLGIEITNLINYHGYICQGLSEFGQIVVLAYAQPYMKMGDLAKYELSTAYSYKVGQILDVGFEYWHLINEFAK